MLPVHQVSFVFVNIILYKLYSITYYLIRYMDVLVRCEKDDPELLFTYDSAMLVSVLCCGVLCCGVLCCGRYACVNARAQMKACTKEWLNVPVGFFSDRQMRAGIYTFKDIVIRGNKHHGWGMATMFRQPWIESTCAAP